MATSKIDRIICYYGIGSGNDPTRRYVQFVTPQMGWAGFVQQWIVPLVAQGVRRFLLWMPHGREINSRKQLVGNNWISTYLRYDAWRLAQKNLANTWFTNGFSQAVYPLTSEGIEIIAYVGTLHGAPEFDSLSRGLAQWEAIKAISPLIDAGCSIALDTSIKSKPGHYVYDLAQVLKQAGYRYYIEPTPHVDDPQWFDSSCVVSDEQWSNVINPVNQYILAPPSQLKGEIIRGWFGKKPSFYPTTRDWFNWTVPAALWQGHSCCLPMTDYFRAGGTLAELVR